jgi:hypothetical protein
MALKTETLRPPCGKTASAAVTEWASTVELFGDPGHGERRERGVQIAVPCEILQTGITKGISRQQRDTRLAHSQLLDDLFPAKSIDGVRYSVIAGFLKTNPHHI